METRYIGDGVYASFDGYQIWLKTDRGDGMMHEIAIEPEVLSALNAYAADIKKEFEAQSDPS